jgi:uncharacterized protein YkwD
MLARGYFSHTSADGTPFWKRVLRSYPQEPGTSWFVGENLLWSSATKIAPDRALELWMASPGHRANILNARWREIGVAAVQVDSAPGVFRGRSVVVVATNFGIRG